MRVLVTRPKAQAQAWVRDLQAAGLTATTLPLIATRAVPDPIALQAAWSAVPSYDALMFVSANAVDAFFAARPEGAVQGWAAPRWWVTGPGSRAALLSHGVPAAQVDAPGALAVQWDSEALWQVVGTSVQPGMRVLIVRGRRSEATVGSAQDIGTGRDWLSQQLTERGASVDWVVAYERCAPVWDDATRALAVQSASDGAVWVFSASEAVSNLLSLCPHQPWHAARAVATHPRIAQAARAAGFGVVCESRPDLGSVVRTLKSLA